MREEATGNPCPVTKDLVQERVSGFLAKPVSRKVKRRCRAVLQSSAEGLLRDSRPDSQRPENAHPTLALVLGCDGVVQTSCRRWPLLPDCRQPISARARGEERGAG